MTTSEQERPLVTGQPDDGTGVADGLFAGVRILEFSWFGAGPIAAKWYADLGADVVRVESVVRPDALRFGMPRPVVYPTDPNASGYFNNFNSSKRSITLEMGHPEALKVAKRLIDWCDVVVENFRPTVMARWGLDYETVSADHPELIYVSMPAVGREGPRAGYAGFGTGIKMISGLAMLSGTPDQIPIGPPGAFPDYVINCGHGGASIIAALLHRQATGEGQFIEVAQMESSIAVTGTAVLEATVNGRAAERIGNRHPVYCPHGVFSCAGDAAGNSAGDDDWVAIAVTIQAEWEVLCRTIGRDEWLVDPRLATLPARRHQVEELEKGVEAWTRHWPARHVEEVLREAGVPVAKAQTNQELLQEDDHLRQRRYYWTLDHPLLGPTSYDATPFRLSETPAWGRRPAPLLGEHNVDVYQEAGFDMEEIADLVAQGIISG